MRAEREGEFSSFAEISSPCPDPQAREFIGLEVARALHGFHGHTTTRSISMIPKSVMLLCVLLLMAVGDRGCGVVSESFERMT